MKREDIKKVLPNIIDEALGRIMDLHSADVGGLKQQVTTRIHPYCFPFFGQGTFG